MLVLASLVQGFATLNALSGFVVVRLYLTPMRPCLDVTIWDASPWCWLLRAYLSPFPLHAMICFSCLFVPPVGFLCIFTHLLMCSCISLACQCVVYASTQWGYGHSIQTYIVPRGHHLLFAFLFVCFLACLIAFLFLCLPCLSCLFVLCLSHMLFASFPSITCLLVSCLCLCMYTHGVKMLGARAQSPGRKQKGREGEHVEISQVVVFSRFKSLVYPFGYVLF